MILVYAPFGDINSLIYGNALSLTQSFDLAYRTAAQTVPATHNLAYPQYDANGNLQLRNDLVNGITDTFLFDNLDRLDIANGVFGTRDYDYDKNGNRTQLDDGSVTSYGYAANSNRMNQNGADSVVLDANGNTTSVGNRSYTHNANNRILEVFDSGVLKATYSYNGLGQRISKTVSGLQTQYIYGADGLLLAESDDGGVSFTEYFYLNKQLLAMQAYSAVSTKLSGNANALQQLTNNATANDASGLLTLQSLQKPLKSIKSEKAQSNNSNNKTTTARTHAFELYYVHNDHLGTPKAMTDEFGVKVWSATHDPFGMATVDVSSSVELNVRFPGQYYDSETQLHYNYFRYYDPGAGRYVTSDPIGLRGGLNTFGYANGNPIKYIDILGLIITGEWAPEPFLVLGTVDFAPYDLSLTFDIDHYATMHLLIVSGVASGMVEFGVKCEDDCTGDKWSYRRTQLVSKDTDLPLGTNLLAMAVGGKVGAALNVLINLVKGSSVINTKLMSAVQEIRRKGPYALCNGM